MVESTNIVPLGVLDESANTLPLGVKDESKALLLGVQDIEDEGKGLLQGVYDESVNTLHLGVQDESKVLLLGAQDIKDENATFRCIKCKNLIQFSELKKHEQFCEKHQYFCYCNELVPANDLFHPQTHNQPTICTLCNNSFPKIQYSDHYKLCYYSCHPWQNVKFLDSAQIMIERERPCTLFVKKLTNSACSPTQQLRIQFQIIQYEPDLQDEFLKKQEGCIIAEHIFQEQLRAFTSKENFEICFRHKQIPQFNEFIILAKVKQYISKIFVTEDVHYFLTKENSFKRSVKLKGYKHSVKLLFAQNLVEVILEGIINLKEEESGQLKIEIFAHSYDFAQASDQILEQGNSILIATFYLQALPKNHEYGQIEKSLPFYNSINFSKFKLSIRLVEVKELKIQQDYIKFSNMFQADRFMLKSMEAVRQTLAQHQKIRVTDEVAKQNVDPKNSKLRRSGRIQKPKK